MLIFRKISFLALYSLTSSVLAEYQPDREVCPQTEKTAKPVSVNTSTDNQTIISADDSSTHENIFSLDGHVVISDSDKRIQADHINFDNETGLATLKGDISLQSDAFRVSARNGQANTRSNTAEFEQINYQLTQFSGRGKADSITLHDKQTATLKKLTYSTCPPQKQDWVLKARQVKIDQKTETADARNVSVWFKDMPLIYLPRFSFPTGDKRKSGFLNPSFGNSSKTGTELRVPWYWNIAPNRDDTIHLNFMSDRGVQIRNEYRHLHTHGSSALNFEFLGDKITNDDRYLGTFRHSGKLNSGWKARADLSYVSDQQYFNDLGESLENSNITHLPRSIELQKDHALGYFLIRAHEFQSINVANAYQRLPQLMLDLETNHNKNREQYSLQAELTRFEHRDDVVTGSRLDLSPGVHYEWNDSAYYIKPAFKMRHTRYQLDNTAVGQKTSLSRSTPIFSLDSGMFFERPLQLWDQSQTLTLEPRVFYLYSKYKDQGDIPLFDTTIPDFRFAELFRTNGFSGPDRQSDANQLTLALSSRLIDNQQNRERLRLNIGQTFYFNDRRVTLTGNDPETSSYSNFTGELEGQFTQNTQFRVSGLWDHNTSQVNKAVIAFGYQRDKKHILNMNYRYQRNLFEQMDLSTRWSLGKNWNGFASWTYSLQAKQSIESAFGLEYDSCCWSIQVGSRRFLNNTGTENDNSVYIQLNLKGLTSIGPKFEDLNESKLGYRTRSAVQ